MIKQRKVKTITLKEALRDEQNELMSCFVFKGKELKQYNALFGVSYGKKKLKTANKTQAFMRSESIKNEDDVILSFSMPYKEAIREQFAFETNEDTHFRCDLPSLYGLYQRAYPQQGDEIGDAIGSVITVSSDGKRTREVGRIPLSLFCMNLLHSKHEEFTHLCKIEPEERPQFIDYDDQRLSGKIGAYLHKTKSIILPNLGLTQLEAA